MRRLLKDIAEGRAMGDTSTLADASIVDLLKKNVNQKTATIQKTEVAHNVAIKLGRNKISIPDTAVFNRCKDESYEGYSYTVWFSTPAKDGLRHPVTHFYCFQWIERLNSVSEIICAVTNIMINNKDTFEAIFANGAPDFSHAVINEGNITDDLAEEAQICFCGSEG